MEDGGCVTGGALGPVMFYYPSWEFMSYSTGATIDDYEISTETPLMEWDVGSTPFGPMC